MTKLLSCRYNMDTNQVEARFEDGTTLPLTASLWISKAGGYHHVVAVQPHGRFDMLVEKVHGAVPIDLIRMGNADGIHALLRRKAAQSKMMCLDLAVQPARRAASKSSRWRWGPDAHSSMD